MIVANSRVQWPSWTWCRKWWNHSWHSSRVTFNQRYFAFILPRTPLVYRYHVISRTQSHSAVFGCSPSGWMPGVAPRAPRVVTLLTVGQLLYRVCFCIGPFWPPDPALRNHGQEARGMPGMMKPLVTQSLKMSVISFVRALLWYIDIMSFRDSELQHCFWMLPIGINRGASTTAFDNCATSLVSD